MTLAPPSSTALTDIDQATGFDPDARDDDATRRFDLADAAQEWIDARPGRAFNASQVARGINCPTQELHPVLDFLARHVFITRCGRGGSWARYTSRRSQ